MKVTKQDLFEQIVIALRDEFNATITCENNQFFICFPNKQTFCLSLQEI